MNTHPHFFILITALILTACTARNVRIEGGMLLFDVEDVKEGHDIPVETLAESVEVIPLETADNAFFGFSNAWLSENYVIVRAENGLVRIFGRDGRFVGFLEGVDEWSLV